MEQVDAQRGMRSRGTEGCDARQGGGASKLGFYLRRLREGYGYTLRKVEEESLAYGETIDNSQLSRFEKGKTIPSFEKLRALARVFNIPVQNFVDVLDLEEYERFQPRSDDYAELLKLGADWVARGEPGRALASYERAVAVAAATPDPDRRAEMTAEARWRLACALKALGKLYMCEQELRAILKEQHRLPPRSRLRALLQLSYLYRELGDRYLAAVLARDCLALADELGDLPARAGVLNTLGNILQDEEEVAEAARRYEEAIAVLDRLQGNDEMRWTVMTNFGACLVALGRHEEGVRLLRAAYSGARLAEARRVAALALMRLAEASLRSGDLEQARQLLTESDGWARRPDCCFNDILFLNAFHRWRMARSQGNATAEKIAFGRLRHLRALLQRRFPEVDEFDRHVERSRR